MSFSGRTLPQKIILGLAVRRREEDKSAVDLVVDLRAH